jgi:hypothetical protein
MLRPYVVVRVGEGKGSNAAASPLALPTTLLLQRNFFLTLCKVIKRALFSTLTNFLILVASFSYYIIPRLLYVRTPLLSHSFYASL